MKAKVLHSWQVSIAEAEAIQRKLASLVSRRSDLGEVKLIAGSDISAPDSLGIARAAVVVLRYPELTPVEEAVVEGTPNFPYVPGLLSFREAPLILAAFEQLSTTPDLLMVDGQGIAHPRRLGIASHLGLLLDLPTIGCAKSILRGKHEPLGEPVGSTAVMVDRGEIVGMAVRTRQRANPVYISIGHKIDMETAVYWVLKCCRGYRLPEPTRLAHLAAGGKFKATQVGLV